MRLEKAVRPARAEALVGTCRAGFFQQNGFLLPRGTPLTHCRFRRLGNAIRKKAILHSGSSQKSAEASLPCSSAIHDFPSEAFIREPRTTGVEIAFYLSGG
jgi:hypothetical protein